MGKLLAIFAASQKLRSVLQIDTSNITNAFVSGMKEDLGFYGNEYNYIVTSWTIGYIIGQLVSSSSPIQAWLNTNVILLQPSNFILTRVPAHSMLFYIHSCFRFTETYLTVFSQSGSHFLRLVGQYSPLVLQVQIPLRKCLLFDS